MSHFVHSFCTGVWSGDDGKTRDSRESESDMEGKGMEHGNYHRFITDTYMLGACAIYLGQRPPGCQEYTPN